MLGLVLSLVLLLGAFIAELIHVHAPPGRT